MLSALGRVELEGGGLAPVRIRVRPRFLVGLLIVPQRRIHSAAFDVQHDRATVCGGDDAALLEGPTGDRDLFARRSLPNHARGFLPHTPALYSQVSGLVLKHRDVGKRRQGVTPTLLHVEARERNAAVTALHVAALYDRGARATRQGDADLAWKPDRTMQTSDVTVSTSAENGPMQPMHLATTHQRPQDPGGIAAVRGHLQPDALGFDLALLDGAAADNNDGGGATGDAKA
mmetsp:Transcript_30363/g.100773  ORF Transcript_30363/g.100773 Transcript_30363/m.100773 type:complete len:231 (-) Transcript_30363:288-980(-)